MNWKVILATALLGFGVYAIAGDVTQTASWSLNDGERDVALRRLVETDVPAIITEINSVNSTFNGTLISNSTLKVYALTLEVKSGGTVTVPAGSITAASLAGNVAWARISNGVSTTISGDGAVNAAGALTLTDNAVPATEVGAGEFPSDVYIKGEKVRGTALTNGSIGVSVQAYDADLADLADGSLTASKVASGYDATGLSGNVPAVSITNAVATGLYDQIGTNQIAASGVGSDEIAPNSITSSEMYDNAVGAAEITDNTVGTNEMLMVYFTGTLNTTNWDGKSMYYQHWSRGILVSTNSTP